jgi:hypothetical protein
MTNPTSSMCPASRILGESLVPRFLKITEPSLSKETSSLYFSPASLTMDAVSRSYPDGPKDSERVFRRATESAPTVMPLRSRAVDISASPIETGAAIGAAADITTQFRPGRSFPCAVDVRSQRSYPRRRRMQERPHGHYFLHGGRRVRNCDCIPGNGFEQSGWFSGFTSALRMRGASW